MRLEPTAIDGCLLVRFSSHLDIRGEVNEIYREDIVDQLLPFRVAQINLTHSVRGVVRGMHFSTWPGGQSKLVVCVKGAVRDVCLDVRRESTTFGKHLAFDLNESSNTAILLSSGMAHGVMTYSDNSSIIYLMSSPYRPDYEHTVSALDPDLNIDWPPGGHILSDRDKGATRLSDFPIDLLPTL